jgi:hypothetical protein
MVAMVLLQIQHRFRNLLLTRLNQALRTRLDGPGDRVRASIAARDWQLRLRDSGC